jgi:hypothetical protein
MSNMPTQHADTPFLAQCVIQRRIRHSEGRVWAEESLLFLSFREEECALRDPCAGIHRSISFFALAKLPTPIPS